jgi:cyclic pyranopterin phosphate synthase
MIMTEEYRLSPWANSKIRLVITSECNIDCFYCHNEGHGKAQLFMPLALANYIATVVSASGETPKISIVGGEPTIHDDLNTIVSTFADIGLYVSITTNGLELDKARLKKLQAAGCKKVRFGVDSIIRKRSRPSHGLTNSRPITDTIKAAIEVGIIVELNTVITQFNVSELVSIVTFCVSNSIDVKFYEHVKLDRFASKNSNASIIPAPFYSPDDFDSMLRNAVDIENSFISSNGANFVYHAGKVEIRYCRYLHPYGLCYISGTRIGPNGYVSACMEKSETVRISPANDVNSTLEMIRSAIALGCTATGGKM